MSDESIYAGILFQHSCLWILPMRQRCGDSINVKSKQWVVQEELVLVQRHGQLVCRVNLNSNELLAAL
eukprot:scaffold14921_cov79-Skeletonema_marinoi.AAC.2